MHRTCILNRPCPRDIDRTKSLGQSNPFRQKVSARAGATRDPEGRGSRYRELDGSLDGNTLGDGCVRGGLGLASNAASPGARKGFLLKTWISRENFLENKGHNMRLRPFSSPFLRQLKMIKTCKFSLYHCLGEEHSSVGPEAGTK